ncbi:hypothetical protein [Polaromonas sp.]|uniref:hypothetical protein n=1 Tax=Polaromonas sp. TaxID=1869339 RepID=UPI00273096FD|nr:hypothetical protein [Polaromonas sp.]MDP1740080.1 hypothetical protein [Polaromonas sp.]
MNRFTEPSTWAGLAALFQVVASFAPPQYGWIAHALTAAAGSAAVGLREKATY